MSKERELLKEFIDFVDSYEFYPTERNIIWEIVSRANELLAQPEPFGPEERQRLSKAYSTRAEQVAFEEGIIFAEISYGIGVDDE
jgi:methionyl-tRNA synthetase